MSPTAMGSIPGEGLVESMKVGSLASARAISQRRRSPPDRAMEGDLRKPFDMEFLEQRIGFALTRLAVRLHRFQDRANIVLDIQPAKDRGFLRQIADPSRARRYIGICVTSAPSRLNHARDQRRRGR